MATGNTTQAAEQDPAADLIGAPYPLDITVAGVEYVERYVIRVTFGDGFSHLVDLEDELDGEVFEPLKDLAVFSKVRFDEESGTAVWPTGVDLAPEFLRYGPDRPDCPCPIHEAGRRLAAQLTG